MKNSIINHLLYETLLKEFHPTKNLVLSNCLATTHPELSKEWHTTKNVNLTPFNVTAGNNKKVYWICNKNHEWLAKINNRTSTNRNNCPTCNESHGEKEIAIFLNKSIIPYEREKKFDGCKHKRKLPFDFYLLNENILIEYDGILHYKSDAFMGGKKAFEELKIRDAIKTKFAQDNKIPLLRIPYKEFDNIENIISSFIFYKGANNI